MDVWEGQDVGELAVRCGVPRLEIHESIGSTNDRALELVREGAAPFTTVLADEQTAGRGRSGAVWHSSPGSGIWMSVVLPAAPAGALHIPLLVGLAVADAVSCLTGIDVRIEWPNDLTVGGRKLAGILCEGTRGGVVAGIGLNVRVPEGGFPEGIAERAMAIDAYSAASPSRVDLLVALSRALRRHLSDVRALLRPSELGAIEALDALRDQRVETAQAGKGVGRGVDPDGAFRLERPDGTWVRVVAGAVRPA